MVPGIERRVRWIRRNAAVLALGVAVLTFIGGAFSGVGAAVWYVSTLATTNDLGTAVREALGPLNETVRSLSGTVNDLRETAAGLQGLKGTVDRLGETVGTLREAVAGLEGLRGTVDRLSDAVSNLEGTVAGLDGSAMDGPETSGRGAGGDAAPGSAR